MSLEDSWGRGEGQDLPYTSSQPLLMVVGWWSNEIRRMMTRIRSCFPRKPRASLCFVFDNKERRSKIQISTFSCPYGDQVTINFRIVCTHYESQEVACYHANYHALRPHIQQKHAPESHWFQDQIRRICDIVAEECAHGSQFGFK